MKLIVENQASQKWVEAIIEMGEVLWDQVPPVQDIRFLLWPKTKQVMCKFQK